MSKIEYEIKTWIKANYSYIKRLSVLEIYNRFISDTSNVVEVSYDDFAAWYNTYN